MGPRLHRAGAHLRRPGRRVGKLGVHRRHIVSDMLQNQDDPRHGTVNGYNNHDCRCPGCRAAQSKDCIDRKSRRSLTPDDPRHGTANGYQNYNCRCPSCSRAAGHKYSRQELRERRAEAERSVALKREASIAGLSTRRVAVSRMHQQDMGVGEISLRLGVSRSTVQNDLRDAGVVLTRAGLAAPGCANACGRLARSRNPGDVCTTCADDAATSNSTGRYMDGLRETNRDRTLTAAQRTTAKAREALGIADLTEQTRDALELRVANPDVSLAELAQRMGITKDRYAGILRRALK